MYNGQKLFRGLPYVFCMFQAFILTDPVLRFPAPGITPNSFPSGNEPEQKRAALLCKFFAKGWCMKGNSCRFLHVKETSNHAMAGSSYIQSDEGM